MRLLTMIACAVLGTLVGVMAGHAEKRVALVIGNGTYELADRLANPVTDARRIRDALSELGFEVVYGENLGKLALERIIGRFADTVQDADVALVFYAGHGATFGDVPYVVPVDAQFSSLRQVPYELVPVETLIGELRQAKGLRIAILDACRDNAAERELKRTAARGGEITRGLARVKNPEGLILVYATQYLSTAADDGPNGDSPFTAALLNHIAMPGLDVTEMFRRVGREVIATTQGRQRPEISVSFYDAYALVPAPAPTVIPLPIVSPPMVTPQELAAQAWAAVKDTNSIPALEAFVRRFGDSFYVDLAQLRIDELRKQQTAANVPPVVPAVPQRQEPVLLPAAVPPVAPPSAQFDPCSGPVTVSFSKRCAAPLTAAEERGLKPAGSFKECVQCPEMVVVPVGSFTMGSPTDEKNRRSDEGPQRVVSIGKPFAVGKFHVTVDQFAAFVAATGYYAGSSCWIWDGSKFADTAGRSWRNPFFQQEGSHPAICLNWNDAKAFVDWLARTTGKGYRLLTEAEWEYAARGRTTPGSYPRYSFGDDERDLCRNGNGMDQTAKSTVPGASRWTIAPCDDGYAYTSPVGSFAPNGFGLYDMQGNAWQWTEDCYHATYTGARSDGSAWTTGDCSRVLRGGSWLDNPGDLRAANRVGYSSDYRIINIGFRVGRTLITP